MKIQLYSDLHLEGGNHFYPPQTDSDVIVLAGDIWSDVQGLYYAHELAVLHNKPVIYVPGNHEYWRRDIYRVRAGMKAVAAKMENVILLDKDMAIMNGTRFIGATFWTDFRLDGRLPQSRIMSVTGALFPDFRQIRVNDRPFTPPDMLEMHLEEKDYIDQMLSTPFDGPSVVITHYGPSLKAHHPHFPMDEKAGLFISDHDSLVSMADFWLFGHTHANIDLMVGDCRLISNQRGYFMEKLPAPFTPDGLISL